MMHSMTQAGLDRRRPTLSPTVMRTCLAVSIPIQGCSDWGSIGPGSAWRFREAVLVTVEVVVVGPERSRLENRHDAADGGVAETLRSRGVG